MLQLKSSRDEGIISRPLGDILCDQVWFSCLMSLWSSPMTFSLIYFHNFLWFIFPHASSFFCGLEQSTEASLKKTKLKRSDFYQLTLVHLHNFFSNNLTCKILFIDTHKMKIKKNISCGLYARNTVSSAPAFWFLTDDLFWNVIICLFSTFCQFPLQQIAISTKETALKCVKVFSTVDTLHYCLQ